MKKAPLYLFISLLLFAGLACNALVSEGDTAPAANTDEVVRIAVATVRAEVATEIAAQAPAISTSGALAVDSQLEAALVEIYQKVNPAVVYIVTESASIEFTSGSGFLYDAEGHIVTNNHVVSNADGFEVVFADGTRSPATLVGSDVHSDLAVIEVEEVPEGISPVTLGEFNGVQVGQFAVAIGNPFGEQGSISLGIVSGLGRSLRSQEPAEGGGFYSLPEVIQTDAPINPGNSGGPLLNLSGQIIGVNSAIRSDTGFNSGVGFAIPVAAVRRVVPALIADGEYKYPYLGIGTPPGVIDLEAQELLNLPQASGVYVTNVTEGGPAEEAGIVAAPSARDPGGDLIVAIDGREVKEFNDLISYLVFETEVGQTVQLTLFRDGEQMTVPLVLGERP